jgi:hypothetical protein
VSLLVVGKKAQDNAESPTASNKNEWRRADPPEANVLDAANGKKLLKPIFISLFSDFLKYGSV